MNPMEIQKVIRQFLCKWLSCMTKLLCDFSKFITSSKLDSYSLGDDFFSWGGNSQFSLKFVWFAYLGFGLGQIHLFYLKLFCFSFLFNENWWSCSYLCVPKLHQVSLNLKEKRKKLMTHLTAGKIGLNSQIKDKNELKSIFVYLGTYRKVGT